MWYAFGALAALALIVIFYIISTKNRFVVLGENVENSGSQIGVLLKKRFDLIPNLVNTVKGYATHESGTLEKITSLRASIGSARTPQQTMELNNEMGQAISRLLVAVEAYPELKANANFLDLQGQLTALENQIGMARQFYNDTVTKFNRLAKMFPSSMVANMFHYQPKAYYAVPAEETAVPKVEF